MSDEEYTKVRSILAEWRAHVPCTYEFHGKMQPRKLRVFRMDDSENRTVTRLMRLWKIGANESLIRSELEKMN